MSYYNDDPYAPRNKDEAYVISAHESAALAFSRFDMSANNAVQILKAAITQLRLDIVNNANTPTCREMLKDYVDMVDDFAFDVALKYKNLHSTLRDGFSEDLQDLDDQRADLYDREE